MDASWDIGFWPGPIYITRFALRRICSLGILSSALMDIINLGILQHIVDSPARITSCTDRPLILMTHDDENMYMYGQSVQDTMEEGASPLT